MLIAILILTIFNTGLIILLGLGGIAVLKQATIDVVMAAMRHTDESIESATTAVFNMDSIKQKAEMSGKAEL